MEIKKPSLKRKCLKMQILQSSPEVQLTRGSLDIRTILVCTLIPHSTKRSETGWFWSSVFEKQSDHTVRRNIRNSHIADSCSIVCMSPQILKKHLRSAGPRTEDTDPNGVLSTRSNPCRFSKVKKHGGGLVQCIQLHTSEKQNSNGVNILTNMKTVPFWLGPLQY